MGQNYTATLYSLRGIGFVHKLQMLNLKTFKLISLLGSSLHMEALHQHLLGDQSYTFLVWLVALSSLWGISIRPFAHLEGLTCHVHFWPCTWQSFLDLSRRFSIFFFTSSGTWRHGKLVNRHSFLISANGMESDGLRWDQIELASHPLIGLLYAVCAWTDGSVKWRSRWASISQR